MIRNVRHGVVHAVIGLTKPVHLRQRLGVDLDRGLERGLLPVRLLRMLDVGEHVHQHHGRDLLRDQPHQHELPGVGREQEAHLDADVERQRADQHRPLTLWPGRPHLGDVPVRPHPFRCHAHQRQQPLRGIDEQQVGVAVGVADPAMMFHVQRPIHRGAQTGDEDQRRDGPDDIVEVLIARRGLVHGVMQRGEAGVDGELVEHHHQQQRDVPAEVGPRGGGEDPVRHRHQPDVRPGQQRPAGQGRILRIGDDRGQHLTHRGVVGDRHGILFPGARPAACGVGQGYRQGSADGGDGHFEAVVVLQVPGDGVRAGVEAFAGELGAQGDDEVDGGLG